MFLIKYDNPSDILVGYFHFYPKFIIISLENHCWTTAHFLFLNEKINIFFFILKIFLIN